MSLWDPRGNTFVDVPADTSILGARPFKMCLYRHEGRPYMACALTDGMIATWDLADIAADPVMTIGHSGPIWTLIAIPGDRDDTNLIASGSSDQLLNVWEPVGGGKLRQRQGTTPAAPSAGSVMWSRRRFPCW